MSGLEPEKAEEVTSLIDITLQGLEKEAEEEMKQELMRKEEQLLEEMAKLETDNQAKDLENATLRKEMAKMKTLLDEQTKGREILEAREVERRVQLDIKKRERERMEAEVRAKREARIKHQKQQQQVRRDQLPQLINSESRTGRHFLHLSVPNNCWQETLQYCF